MRTYETCIKSCSEEYVYLDKKMRERRYKVDKYIIVLDESAPFIKGDLVRIISEDDFQKLFHAVKKLKMDKMDLIEQIADLKTDTEFHNLGEHQQNPDHNSHQNQNMHQNLNQDKGLIKWIKNVFR